MAKTQNPDANIRTSATTRPLWGLAATIKAPAPEILDFAAHHLELGAHRLYIYLDDDNPDAFAPLKAHPKIRVTRCDDRHWQKLIGRRPEKHQLRQTANATHAYNRRVELDWLIHMDVDEFLWPDNSLQDHLDLGPQVLCARVRPQELLSGSEVNYKAFIRDGTGRAAIVARLYPQFGPFLKGGFLSHVAGKLFVRTGQDNLRVKIHNVFRDTDQGEQMNPGEVDLPGVALCHHHAKSWDAWVATYHYRLQQGSYRAELARNRPAEHGGLSMHELFNSIESDSGRDGLRAFFDEVCADSPHLRARLDAEGLLRRCDLDLGRKRRKHFPESG